MEDEITELMKLCLWILRLGIEAGRVKEGCDSNGTGVTGQWGCIAEPPKVTFLSQVTAR